MREKRKGRSTEVGIAPRTGFTLLEMIVVMAIIAMLLGLLLPALGSVRQRSDSALCQSRLREIGGALQTLRQQNEGLLPRAAPLPSNDPFGPPDGLPGALRHIIDPHLTVWCCPGREEHDENICTSYFYVAGAFMMFYADDPYPAAREVTRFFESGEGSSVPVLWDSEDRHFSSAGIGRNGLYIDGHVTRVGEPFTMPGQTVERFHSSPDPVAGGMGD